MTGSDIVAERRFASTLEAMTDEELFDLMAELEMGCEAPERLSVVDDLFAKIVLTESAIERRFPGQMLRPYKDWQSGQKPRPHVNVQQPVHGLRGR
ncbi:hypothetical protein [Rhizobium mulingense]|uniref:hypothetical protein n=1 Tax=Rhizobium mulingense TaxID=3031128 RepID=UPI002B4A60B7|nr:hypothetical protein [Rhizobium sp. MJ21]MEB3045987.1 hypothetical protein [Rhizobium sp. MJ21]